jgi:uncharacterized protein (TIGR02466 family)
MNFTVENLFPTPVFRTNIGRAFTKKELLFIDQNRNDTYSNEGNITSSNTYVLEKEPLKKLKQYCLDCTSVFLQNVHKPNCDVTPFITQSWLNWTEPGEYHHVHAHQNSFISGVLYLHAEEEDKIKFWKSGYEQIKLETNDYNIYNSNSWWFPVNTGDIILFPSSTLHSVEKTESKKTRVSLAFNTFLSGNIGDQKTLRELKI